MSSDSSILTGGQRVLRLLLRGNTLQFPDDLETAFRAQHDAAARGSLRAAACMMLVVIGVFALLDPFALPSTYRYAWSVRPGLQVAPALGLALFAASAWMARRVQMLVASSLVLGALGTLLILAGASPDEWGYFLYPYALAQIGALAYTGSRLRFPWAIAVGGFLLAGYVVSALWGQHILAQPRGVVAFVLPLFFLVAINVIGASACLNTERLLRNSFLQQRIIDQERARADALLADMLPVAIVERLKRAEPVADDVSEASVLFADLTRFTELAAQAPAARVVALLDALFTRFDVLAARHGVEKIKTIGDAYMAASGVPAPRPGQVQALARLALDMRDTVAALRSLEPDLDVRIGIATGPLMAGVIGRQRRLYDLWGDTVNLASRLESHGLPGKIQVDARTHACLQAEFDLVPRGRVALKGLGECSTYWLMAARGRTA